jgi:hypothetical protein
MFWHVTTSLSEQIKAFVHKRQTKREMNENEYEHFEDSFFVPK